MKETDYADKFIEEVARHNQTINAYDDLKIEYDKVVAERDRYYRDMKYYMHLAQENLDTAMNLNNQLSMIRTICETGGKGVGYVSNSDKCSKDSRL